MAATNENDGGTSGRRKPVSCDLARSWLTPTRALAIQAARSDPVMKSDRAAMEREAPRIETDATFTSVGVRSLVERFVPHFSELTQSPVACDSQAVRLLLAYLRMLDAEDTIEDPETRLLVTTHVQDLAALTLSGTRHAQAAAEQRGIRADRLAAVKADILGNLASPELSVASVAARQGLTPRYIHMLFEAESVTFSEYVVGKRLARAQRILTDPRFADQTISVIALGVGFGDLSYFNRAFRRHFGMTPSDMREASRRGREIGLDHKPL
ncbi:helix-turn-helix transcriptional regulator [Bradyrhizobium manausense]|nr:helix-turn-helix transcriptional regulator [Bradyrhizobium manausense]